MFDPNETLDEDMDPAALACLNRTRSSVLNVLVAVGITVALTGALLRGRAAEEPGESRRRWGEALLAALFLVFVASTILRRWLGSRARLRDPVSREPRFYWGHVVPALVGALAAPLGLAYGVLVSPRLEAILPFWAAALVLGILTYPRGRELAGFERPMTTPGEPF